MVRRIAWVFVALLVSVALARAQDTTATILGTVTDSSGGALPGATLTLKQMETSQERTVVTDGEGHYRVPALQVGTYDITVSLEGFQGVLRKGLSLSVSQEAQVNFTLSVGAVTDQITVAGGQPLVETTNSTVSNLIDEKQMRALPLNGRSFDQLALLEPGVSTMPFVGKDITAGTSKEVVVAGSRWGTTLFLLDGTEINEGRNGGSASGSILGVEGVQEFRVLTQNVNAEYGRAAGGIITAITRSGTNEIHGSAYEFFRNNNLDAPNYFDQGDPPPFTRNQFGGSFGGPLIKDKTFFFFNVEALRERLGETNVGIVPSANAHNGLLVDPAHPGQFIQVPITPTAKAFLDTLYPLPNAGSLTGTDAGQYISNPTAPTNDNYFTAKVDHTLSTNNKFFVRYTQDTSSQSDDLTIPVSRTTGTIDKYFMTAQDSWIISPRALNVLRIGNNFDRARDSVVDIVDVPDNFKFVPNYNIGNLTITGFSGLGEGGSLPRYVLNHLFEIADDFSYDISQHSFKFGGMVHRYRSDTEFARRNNGRYSASSLSNFLQGRMRQFEAPIPGTDAERRWLQYLFAFYAQDNWRLGKGVTVSYGVRYEPYTVPKELDGKEAVLIDPLSSEITTGVFFPQNPSKKNVQPRVGVAWDLFGDGKTSLRSAWGRFQNPLLPSTYALDGTRMPPYFQSATLDSPPFPNAYALYQSGANIKLGRDISTYSPNMETPTYDKWHVTLERELPGAISLTVGYSGNRGRNLVRQHEGNTAIPTILPDGTKFFPAGLTVRNPAFGSILVTTTDVTSHYNALNLNVIRRMKDHVSFQLAYTWSKHIDDGSGTLGGTLSTQGAGSGLVSTDPDNVEFDRGLSAWDRRHNFSFNASYELPFGSDRAVNLHGAMNGAFGNWTLNTIVTLSSGVPLNVVLGTFDSLRNLDSRTPNRPDLKPGASNNPIIGDGRDPLHYFDPTAFVRPTPGTFGNVGRNTLISPGLATVDLAFVKRATLGLVTSASAVEFRIEVFNLLNRANFGQPGRTIFAPDGSILPTAGVITDTTTPSRQVQLGVRLTF